MAVNGSTKAPTSAQLRALAGPPLSSTFDVYERMFASFDMGTVFDYGQADARDLREMLRRDGNARKIEQVLTLPLRSAAWEIRPAPGGDREAAYVKTLFTDRLDAVIAQMTSGIIYRKAFFELAWTYDGTDVGIDQIAYRPATSCEAGFDPHTGVHKGFRQRVGNPGGIITIKPSTPQAGDLPGYVTIPAERAMIYTHGVHREPITGLSDFEVASWAYQTKQKILFLWCQFLEQQSTPKVIAYGDDRTQADTNRDALAEAAASAVIGWERSADPTAKMFDVLSTEGAGATQFLQMISYLDSQMSSSVLAGFTDLTALASHSRTQGSYALSADQSEFFLSARQAVADEMAGQITEQLFQRACLYQFGPDAKAPSLKIGPLSKHDKERAVNMLNQLIVAPQFNVPAPFVDLLINSTAGYLGLPVDQVAEMVKDHPTLDPQVAKAKASLIANGTLGLDGKPIPADTVAPTVPPDPAATGGAPTPDAAAMSHAVDVATGLVLAHPPARRKRTRKRH